MKIRTLLFLFFGLIFLFVYVGERCLEPTLPSEEHTVQFYKTGKGEDLRLALVESIRQAEESITLIIYALGDSKLIHALRERAENGVNVTVVYDAEASKGVPVKLGPHVKSIRRKGKGLMHLKLLAIDGRFAWIGTANFTTSSMYEHENLALGFYNPTLAKTIQEKAKRLSAGRLIVSSQPFVTNEFELYFLPENKGGIKRIIKMINSAKKTIRVAMYTWTRGDVTNALIEAHARGVDVEVALDSSQSRGPNKEIAQKLCVSNVPVHLSQGRGLLHHKTMIIDNNTLLTGSANWTKAAFTKNDDCFLILPNLTEEQSSFLQNMWEGILKKCQRMKACD